MKSKLSITKKLFIITTTMFAIFISVTLIVQSLFFERFYTGKKKSDLKSYIDKFRVDYNKADTDQKMLDTFEEYEKNYSIKIIALDENNRMFFLPSSPRFRNDNLNTRELSDFVRQWTAQQDNLAGIDKNYETKTYAVTNNNTGVKYIAAVAPDKDKRQIIFALSSLQPVNEAVGVIERLYLYFCVGAVLFTVILAFIYSNMIAKPLVKINKVATKMAHLDFSEECEIQSEDEIGNVAASLNFLSQNLQNSLTSLRDANAKLEKDIEKERTLEKTRREFVAAVSHELKTPISLIDGYAEGLKDDIFEGEEKEYYLDIIIDEARKMGSLVSDMLDLSYLESGLFKLSRESFNISELIRFTLKKYENPIEEKRVKLDVCLTEETMVFADWNRLEQVLTNFITNALRHVEDEGTVSVRMLNHEHSTVVEIENTGSHISEEDLSKVWDRFYKVDKSRTRKLGGTGIGLSIVKNILVLHGYAFGVENTEDGVKFYFGIPKQQ